MVDRASRRGAPQAVGGCAERPAMAGRRDEHLMYLYSERCGTSRVDAIFR
jgi:hypothetical protein